MDVIYKGIMIDGPFKTARLSHSITVERNKRADYLEKLTDIKRADVSPEQFDEINKLWSVVKMNYQICNGGIDQYFFNGFHKHWISEDKETELFDKATQVSMLRKLHDYAVEVWNEDSASNSKFARIIDFFDALYLEENVPQMEKIYSDEDEYIVDEETGDWVENPDYEEPYEDCVGHEDEIHSDNSMYNPDLFDKDYYEINDYIENIVEGYAQYLTKSIERDKEIDKFCSEHDETFRYQMLDRMRSDCEYYLGNGNRHSKHLWAGNEHNQILYMKALWNSFPEGEKPEWLSMEKICIYEKMMTKKQPSLADKLQAAEVRQTKQNTTHEPNTHNPER